MADGGEILFHFRGDDKQLQSTIDGVQKSLSSLSSGGINEISSSFTKLGGIVTATAGAIVGFGASYNAEIESITMSLETLTGSAEEAQTIMQQIKDDAVKTPFSVKGIAKGQQMLMAQGLSAEDARASVLALGDAISATGGSDFDFSNMLRNLAGIKAMGKMTTKDMYQFQNALIPINQLLAKSMSKSVAEINDMVSKGQISYEDVTNALILATKEGGNFYGAMEKQSHTLNGMISNLKDNFGNLTGTMSSGVTNALKTILPSLNNFIDRLEKLFTQNKSFQAFSEGLLGISNLVAIVLQNLTDDQINIIVDFLVALTKTSPLLLGLGAILPKVASGFSLLLAPSSGIVGFLSSATTGIPILQQVMAVISGLTGPILGLTSAFFNLGLGMTAIVGVLGFLDTQMNGELQKIIAEVSLKAPQIVESIIQAIVSKIPELVTTGQEMLTNIIASLSQMLPSFILLVDTLFEAITSTLSTNGPQLAKLVTDAILKLVQSLYKSEPGFIKATLQIFMAIMTSLKDNLPTLIVLAQETTNEALKVIIDLLPDLIVLGSELIMALIQGLVDQIPALIDQFPLMIDLAVNTMLGLSYLFHQVAYKLILALIEGIKKTAQNLPNVATQIMTNLKNTLLTWLGQFTQIGVRLLQSMSDGVKSKISSILDIARNIISSIINVFRSLDLTQIGANLIRGLWNGISNLGSWVISKIRSLGSSILSAVKNIFGVHSPSTEFAYIGEMNMEGLSVGMLDKQKEVQSQIDGMFNLQPNVSPTMTIQQENPLAEMFANYQERPVVIDVRADEGIIVQKATEGFKEFQRANGRLPF